jgi:hypothetical protein
MACVDSGHRARIDPIKFGAGKLSPILRSSEPDVGVPQHPARNGRSGHGEERLTRRGSQPITD